VRACVLCQAGAGIGLGHFSRASRIAGALESRLQATVQIYVVVPQGEDGLAHFDMAECISSLPPLKEQVLKGMNSFDVFVVDIPTNQVTDDLRNCLAAVRTGGASIVAVDNLELGSQVDLVFLPTFQQPNNIADISLPPRLVYGWDCFLLDEITRPIRWRPGHRVLALTGGCDATNLGRNWPALLDASLPEGTELNWVTGPFAQAPVWPQTPRIRMTQHLAPRGLQHLMTTANYAVTVYGVSFFELLQLGIPTVVFSPYGEKDRAELNEIRRERLAIVASDEVDATEKLVGLMANHSLAAELASRGAEKLGSPGVNRLCEEIRRLQSRKNYKASN